MQPRSKSKTTILDRSAAPVALAMMMWLLPAGAQATTFSVNSADDLVDVSPGDGFCDATYGCGRCTLRAAIMEANAWLGADTIDFDPGVFYVATTIAIRSPLPPISGPDPLTITGQAGSGRRVTVDGFGYATGSFGSIFRINAGAAVDITDLAVIRGNAGTGKGGGIYNSGTLQLTGVIVGDDPERPTPGNGNRGHHGAGIFTDGPLLRLHTCTVSNNSASGATFTGGGGIMAQSFGALVVVVDSTVSGNTAVGGVNPSGGGILIWAGELRLINSTVSGNSAAYGGGIARGNHAPLTLINSTIASNGGLGGGIHAGSGGLVTLTNTLLANGINCNFPSFVTVVSGGHNLSTDASCRLPDSTDRNSTPALLLPLRLNGGTTMTHELGPSNPAIDYVPHVSCPVTNDQRGVFRAQQGPGCDIGAYEWIQ